MSIYFYKEYGELGYLANYSEHGFYANKKYWPTAEHYYQAQKFLSKALQEKIRMASTPRDASNIGRNQENPLRHGWDEIRLEIMLETVLLKFKNNHNILHKLLLTGNEAIIENTDIDYFWGCGSRQNGQNHFGKILMKARSILAIEFVISENI